jgi:hypothetical protein
MPQDPDVFEADVSVVLKNSLTVAGLEEIAGPRMGSMGEADEELEKKERETHRLLHVVGREMHLLICTMDRKYDKLRRELVGQTGQTQLMIVTAIAAAVGAALGAIAAAVVPLVATLLKALLVIGKSAFCEMVARPE